MSRRQATPWMSRAPAALAAAMLSAAPAVAAAASAQDLYYERAVMVAADARCGLFRPDVGATLKLAEAQARGAALRAGVTQSDLGEVRVQAVARAAGAACASRDLQTAAGRVRGAFSGYSRMIRMDFPGDVAGWSADRSVASDAVAWKLSQASSVSGQPLRFGLVGRRGEALRLLAVADFGPGPGPYAARILARDPARAPEAYLGVMRISTSAKIPLSGRVPPRASSRAFMAEARSGADPSLGARTAVAFRFPAAASDALAGLDPREAVTIEFLFAGAGHDQVKTAYIEVGDFAAGRAFAQIPR